MQHLHLKTLAMGGAVNKEKDKNNCQLRNMNKFCGTASLLNAKNQKRSPRKRKRKELKKLRTISMIVLVSRHHHCKAIKVQ